VLKNKTQTFAIGSTAKRVGVCADTLRIWERKGLIHPSRPDKDRMYSLCDIERLNRIKYLIRKKGMNISSVKEMIDMRKCWIIKNCGAQERSKCVVYLNDKTS